MDQASLQDLLEGELLPEEVDEPWLSILLGDLQEDAPPVGAEAGRREGALILNDIARPLDRLPDPLRTEATLDEGVGDAHLLQIAEAEREALVAEINLWRPKRFVALAAYLMALEPSGDFRRRDLEQAASLSGGVQPDANQIVFGLSHALLHTRMGCAALPSTVKRRSCRPW